MPRQLEVRRVTSKNSRNIRELTDDQAIAVAVGLFAALGSRIGFYANLNSTTGTLKMKFYASDDQFEAYISPGEDVDDVLEALLEEELDEAAGKALLRRALAGLAESRFAGLKTGRKGQDPARGANVPQNGSQGA